MDKLADMMLAQIHQQHELLGIAPLDDVEREALQLEMCWGIAEEVQEYARFLGHRYLFPKRSDAHDRRGHRVEQIVDIFKYALALAHYDGVSVEELHEMFMRKTAVMSVRHRKLLETTRVASFDLDGVIGALGYPEEADEDAKHWWYSERLYRATKVFPDVFRLMCQLRGDGWGIVIVTTRKRQLYPALEADTYAWLDERCVPYDRVLFAADKSAALATLGVPIRFHVEDSAKHALDVASGGIRVYYVGNGALEVEGLDIVSCGTPATAVQEIVSDWLVERYAARRI